MSHPAPMTVVRHNIVLPPSVKVYKDAYSDEEKRESVSRELRHWCYWCRATHAVAVDWAGIPVRPHTCEQCAHPFGTKPVGMRERISREPEPSGRPGNQRWG